MTQETLAEALGVTQQAVSAWLRGVTKPSPERIAKIEAMLGVPADDWLAFADGVPPEESGPSLVSCDESGPLPEVARNRTAG